MKSNLIKEEAHDPSSARKPVASRFDYTEAIKHFKTIAEAKTVIEKLNVLMETVKEINNTLSVLPDKDKPR